MDETIWLGLDVHAGSITICKLVGQSDKEQSWTIPNEAKDIRRVFTRLRQEGQIRACYEAGPCGYHLFRQLQLGRSDGAYALPLAICYLLYRMELPTEGQGDRRRCHCGSGWWIPNAVHAERGLGSCKGAREPRSGGICSEVPVEPDPRRYARVRSFDATDVLGNCPPSTGTPRSVARPRSPDCRRSRRIRTCSITSKRVGD